jgi:hypothetical protein
VLAAQGVSAGKLDAKAVQRHYEAILAAAQKNAQLGKGALRADALFDAYLHAMAASVLASGKTEAELETEARSGLAALGLFLDDSALKNPLVGKVFANLESVDMEQAAAKVKGTPTCGGKADAALHFAVSAALAAGMNDAMARMGGQQKEMEDMRGLDHGTGSGYSFRDLAANEAGIRFALWIAEKPAERLKAACAAKQADFFPSLEGLVDGLRTDEFDDKYGPVGSANWTRQMDGIAERLKGLKIYSEEK